MEEIIKRIEDQLPDMEYTPLVEDIKTLVRGVKTMEQIDHSKRLIINTYEEKLAELNELLTHYRTIVKHMEAHHD